MSVDHSPSLWLQQLREGDSVAAQRLWEAYYQKLVGIARRKLQGRVRLVGDEEDVALSAFKSFCRGVERGRYPQLSDRGDMWNLLVTITFHKVLHLVRDEDREKRGGGRKFVAADAATSDADLLQQLVGTEPTPEVAAQVAEEAERLLDCLPSQELVELALLKMEGYTNDEIAKRWQKAERTVERKLNLIRKIWEKDALPSQ
jgi:DNA-directed RNA polymerase specialized sigma24 family protein